MQQNVKAVLASPKKDVWAKHSQAEDLFAGQLPEYLKEAEQKLVATLDDATYAFFTSSQHTLSESILDLKHHLNSYLS